ncbi:MAG: hypothetical protein Q4G28_09180 [Neisseria sp.]|nr:hypothetical protein [Neisseria sp.]
MDSGLRRNDGADAFAMQQKVFCKGLSLINIGNRFIDIGSKNPQKKPRCSPPMSAKL